MIAEIEPDVALKSLLDGNVKIQTSATNIVDVKTYEDGKMPSKSLDIAFLNVKWNGGARSLTSPIGLFNGSLMLVIYCKLLNDTNGQIVNVDRVKSLVSQCESLINNVSSDGFFFKLDPNNVITPTTVNPTTGYSTKTVNVKWRVTDEFINN